MTGPHASPLDHWRECANRTSEALGHIEGLVHALDALRQHHPDLSDSRPATEAIISTIAALVAELPRLEGLRSAEFAAGHALGHQQEDRA